MIGNINLSLKSSLLIILIVGLLLGTVFVFGISYWYAPVSKEECIVVDATYKSFDDYYRGMTHEIELSFLDYEQQTIIDDSIYTNELVNILEQTPSKSKIIMLLHPNSEIIIDLMINDIKVFDFESYMAQLESERQIFAIFGCLFYIGAFAAVIKLIIIRKK